MVMHVTDSLADSSSTSMMPSPLKHSRLDLYECPPVDGVNVKTLEVLIQKC